MHSCNFRKLKTQKFCLIESRILCWSNRRYILPSVKCTGNIINLQEILHSFFNHYFLCIFKNSEYSRSLSEKRFFLAVKTSFVALKNLSKGALDERAVLQRKNTLLIAGWWSSVESVLSYSCTNKGLFHSCGVNN
jgi:hypothetical protein